MKQTPMIVESKLSKPSRWYIVTRYRVKEGIGLDGEKHSYMVASQKIDVTDQMRAILKARRR